MWTEVLTYRLVSVPCSSEKKHARESSCSLTWNQRSLQLLWLDELQQGENYWKEGWPSDLHDSYRPGIPLRLIWTEQKKRFGVHTRIHTSVCFQRAAFIVRSIPTRGLEISSTFFQFGINSLLCYWFEVNLLVTQTSHLQNTRAPTEMTVRQLIPAWDRKSNSTLSNVTMLVQLRFKHNDVTQWPGNTAGDIIANACAFYWSTSRFLFAQPVIQSQFINGHKGI